MQPNADANSGNLPSPLHEQESARQVERRFLRILVGWGVGSLVIGVPLFIPFANPLLRACCGAVGSQFVIWGLIDAILAGFGLRAMQRREALPLDRVSESARIAKAIRALSFNLRLDVLWVSIGLALAGYAVVATGPARWSLAGHGGAVLVQGIFLLLFDRRFRDRIASAARL